MRLDKAKVCSLFAVALLSSSYAIAAPDYATDSFSDLDLDAFSELDVVYGNYADVSLNNTHNSNVAVSQTHYGIVSNKVIISMNNASGSDINLRQVGSGNIAAIEQRNGINELDLLQVGYGHEAYVVQEGSFNRASIAQVGRSSEVNLTQLNGANYAKIVDFRGSDYDITQSGNSKVVIRNNMRRHISIKH